MPGLLVDMESQGAPVPKLVDYGFLVSHMKVELEIDFSTQSLKGRSEITILPQTRDLQKIHIDARQCVIVPKTVTVNGKVADHEYNDPMKAVDIPKQYEWGPEQFELQRERIKPLTEDMRAAGALVIPLPKGVRIEEADPFSESAAIILTQRALGSSAAKPPSISVDTNGATAAATPLTAKTAVEQRFQPLIVSIPFSTKHFRDGLHFVGLGETDARYPHVYTKHSLDPGTASCIFPCIDDPSMRCTWEVSIKCSRTLGDALKRRPTAHHHSRLLHVLAKKGLVNGAVNGAVNEYEIPLSDEEKLLDITVVCSGEMQNETIDLEDSSKKIVSFACSAFISPQHIGFCIGPFEQVDLSEYREGEDDEKLGQGQTLPVVGYCLPGRADQVRNTCAPMAHALDYFLLTFGSCAFTECHFVFVDDQLRDTEHTAGLSICSNRLLFGEDIIDPEVENVRTLVHAIASQWFGVAVVPNERADRWITIGLSHYMTGLFMKSLCGHNEYAFRQKTLADRLVEMDYQRPSLHALGEILQLGSFEYDFMTLKAPLVLFILDKRIIKATGGAGLARVLSKIVMNANTGSLADSVLSTESFRRQCEKLTRYRQTEPFWNQWILGAGCPRFSISQKFNKKRLCVEMTISQKQDTLPTQRNLEKESFMREFKEDINGVYAGELQTVFTGPMTIRIHEADGTPYEHIVEIRDGNSKIEIPYNTKYKRLKRSRRQRERLNAGPVDISAEGGDEALYYCLGDVLQSPAEVAEWGLQDWDADAEARMEQESYEWVRIDADFEWICDKSFISMPAYMYVSQLQQDRDVVAQQESMLYLRSMNGHPLCSTFLVRTLMDSRYFHGIRTMAAEQLKTHATKQCHWIGLKHLEKAYQEFFCYPNSKMPRSNDFSEKRAYKVEMAIARSLSQIRDDNGNCPQNARHILLDMLRFNDNTNNEYSDNFKIANLLSSLANSLIPDDHPRKAAQNDNSAVGNTNGNDQDEEMANSLDPMVTITEREEFEKVVLEELDRYRRMDEWINSYQNIFTVTVLGCKEQLMKAKIIPVDAVEFAQYLHDGTSDFVRIKAFESLINLGFIRNNSVAALLLNVLSTDPSPYTRSHLFKVFCLGLASVAFGDDRPTELPPPVSVLKKESQDGMVMEGVSAESSATLVTEENEADSGGLIVEQDVSLDARKARIARTTSIEGALAALKIELENNEILQAALWKAINSSVIGVREHCDLLDICFILYDAVESLILKLHLPRYWKVKHLGKGIMHFKHSDSVRTKPSKPLLNVQPPVSKSGNPPPPKVPPPQPQPQPKPAATPFRLSLSTSSTVGAMKPPKRPLPIEPLSVQNSEERPRKILKLKLPQTKVAEILSLPPNPAPIRSAKQLIKSSSPAPRPSPASRASSTVSTSSSAANLSTIEGPTIVMSPSVTPSSTAVKVRKPLPDGSARKPLPESAPRQPLPDSAPRHNVEPAPAPSPAPAPKKWVVKLKTNMKPIPKPEPEQ